MTTPAAGRSIRMVNAEPGQVIPTSLINCYSALAIPAYKRAVTFLAENLASFPRSIAKAGAKDDGRHPLSRLLKRSPNGYQSATTFWRTLFFHACHYANGYARIERHPVTLRPVALHGMQPEDVVPLRYHPDGGGPPEAFYYHRPTTTVLFGADVIHLQTLGWDGVAGMDPIALHESTFQRAATLETYQTQYLRKGTVLRGAIEVPGEMTDDQIAQMRAVLRQFRGPDAQDDILILTSAGKLNNATTSPQESQLLEQVVYTTKQICQITGVPPEFLFDRSDSKYTGVEQAGQDVVRYTFRPWIELIEDELTLKLLTDAELDADLSVHLNPDALLRGDTKTQTDTVVASVNGGLRTRNEGRAVLGLPPDPDPQSDKLATLGAAAPAAGTPTPPAKNAAKPDAAYAALAPVIAAACDRVDQKAAKAFQTHGGKPIAERTIWANVFAEQQARDAADALGPGAAALDALAGRTIDVDAVSQRYAAQVRRRAAGSEWQTLAQLIGAELEGKAA